MAMRWSMWVATSPPPARGRRPSTIRSSPSIRCATPLAASPAATAARRSLSLTRSSCSPFIRVVPVGEGGGDGQDRIFVDHRGRARRRHVDPRQAGMPHPEVRDVLAALDAPVELGDVGAHLPQRGDEADPRGVHHHALDHDLGPGRDQRRDDREGGRGRVGRHDDPVGPAARAAPSARSSPPCGPCGATRTSAPKCASMRSVWSRVASASITVVTPGALRPARSTADFTCAEATGVS